MKIFANACYILIQAFYLCYLSEEANTLHVSFPAKVTTPPTRSNPRRVTTRSNPRIVTTRSNPRRVSTQAIPKPHILVSTRLPGAFPISHQLPVGGGLHLPISHGLTTLHKIRHTRKPLTKVKDSKIKLFTGKYSTTASNLTKTHNGSSYTTQIPNGLASSWSLIVIIVLALFIFLLIFVLLMMCVCCKKGIFHIYREQHRAKTYNRMAEEIRDISTVHPEPSDMSYGTLPPLRNEK